ncbi:acyltransferase family protein [Legionella saoudiensis]|uniref:acyltransferase family protein n=1 Tax=Legionella saoudiensis TaxID=1750561 RepID=UPI000731DA88|nr:acyltransferase [Legionella saoudiensis]
MNDRQNSFDVLRHFAALLVLFSHHFALSGRHVPKFQHWDTYGFVAVAIFFAISGYFMPASFNNSENFLVFMEKRCRRIFPGLIVCSLLMCYVIGSIFTPEPLFQYLTDFSTFKTSVLFSSFLGRPIPGVFSDFIFKDAINGSLWTLPVEFLSYIIIGIVLSYTNSWQAVLKLLLFYILTTIVLMITGFNYMFYAVPLNYLALFGIAFAGGALMAMTQKHWFTARYYLAFVAILFLIILKRRGEMQVLGTLSLAVLTIVIGTSFRDKLIKGRFDISYGIYIYAFPVQQIVINIITQRFWLSMAISVALTIFIAILSYRFVEKPFLYANARNKKREQAVGKIERSGMTNLKA